MKVIQPLQDRIIIKQRKAEPMSKGGLYIPPTAGEKPLEGEVLAVGPGRTLENGTLVAPSVKIGDLVLFAENSFVTSKVDGEEYLIIRDELILGKIIDS